jgi:DNA-binding CsgD family transcriptional regulator/tetratricopeptide (TPR) repeat protein
MASVFVSYRRTDAPGHAGRLYDRLVERFGEARVFKDLDSMEPGADFVEVVEDTIDRCDALVAVIGRHWLPAKQGGERGLNDPQDWMRVELVQALKRGIRVIPVLVQGAAMPSPADLPDDLKALTRRHAVEISEAAWTAQVNRLIDSLERPLARAPDRERREPSPEPSRGPMTPAGSAAKPGGSGLLAGQDRPGTPLRSALTGERRYGRPVGPVAGRIQEKLLERSTELTRIDECVEGLRTGEGRVLVVEGPAGIGKTGLLLAARERARSAGMQVLSARGSDVELDLAWGIVRQLFEPAVLSRTPGERGTLLAGAASLSAAVLSLSSPGSLLAEPTPGDRSFSVLHGLHWLTANLAERAPLVLVVDDAQWADLASLRFLGYLARRLEGLPVGIFLAARLKAHAARPEAPPTTKRILADLRSDPSAEIMHPKALSVEAVGALVQAALRAVPEPGFVDACDHATGGYPYYLIELTRVLSEQGVEPRDVNQGDVHALGPYAIVRHICDRVEQQGTTAVRLAQAVAVLGPGAELRHAAAVARLGIDEASAAADGLAAAGILEDGRPLAFIHPIVSGAIEQDLPAGERASLHARAARTFAVEDVGPERVAMHLTAVDRAGDAWVVEALRAAAHDALAKGAPPSATAYLRRALEEPPDKALRWAVLRDLGFAESYARDAHAEAHLEEALRLATDTDALVGTTMAFGRMLQLAGRAQDAARVYERTLKRLSGDDLAVQVIVEGALVSAALLDRSTAEIASRRLPALRKTAEELRDAHFSVFGPLALAAAGANESAQRVVALARRALPPNQPLLPEAPDRPPFFYYACTALMLAESFDEAQGHLDRTLEDAQRLASHPHFVGLSAFRAWLHLRLGALADAEADARAALGASSETPAFFSSVALAVLVDVLVERGSTEEAERVLTDVGADASDTSITHGVLLGAWGRLHAAAGRHDMALVRYRAAEEHMLAFGFGSPSVVPWRSDAALSLHDCGELDEARRLAREEVELARAFAAPRALGCALRACGIATGGDAGISLLRDAVRSLESSGASLERARALTDLGTALRRSGYRSESQRLLRGGLELAYRCQAKVLAARAHSELAATGARPRRPVFSGVDALTPSERRVAQMAATGRTNREIAQALFVTTRTVEGHLTRVFQKLDVAGRTEIADRLHSHEEALDR